MHHLVRALRLMLALAALVLVVWSFWSVGARTVVSMTGSNREADTTLTVLHWGTPEEEQIVQAMIDAFKAENPDVEVVRIQANDYDAKLKTMLAAGTPPDLFYLRPDDAAEFADTGMLLNLEPYLAAQRAAGEGAWIDAFYPALMDAYRFDDARQAIDPAGDLYAIPKDFTPAVMYINADLFRAAGYTDAQLEAIHRSGWTWDQYREAVGKIAALSEQRPAGQRIHGGVIKHWPDPMRNLLWSFGGAFFGDGETDFRDVQLDSPGSQAALSFIRTLRFEDKSVFNASGLTEGEDDLFRRGRVGVLGPYGRWFTPQMIEVDFDWDVVPLPHAKGVEPSAFLFTVAWAVSSQTEHPEAATALLKFLCNEDGQRRTAQLGLAMPAMKTVAQSPAFLDTAYGPDHVSVFLDAAETGRLPAFPRNKQFNRILDAQMKETLVLDSKGPAEAAARAEELWSAELASPLQSKDYAPMPWGKVSAVTGGFLLISLAGLVWLARREKLGKLAGAQERTGWLFISPWVLGFLLLVIGPILLALLLSLTKWSAMAPLAEAEFVGLDNYRHMAYYDSDYAHSLWVTVYYTLLAVPTMQVLALLIAVLMNVNIKGVAMWRTVFFLPSVVTGVALVTLWIAMFDNERGIINRAISALGLPAPDWFGQDGATFAIPAIVIMSLWGVGGGMVIYLAGLKGIPRSLYEAATIDGAGPVRQFFSITLPMLSPLIFFNLVMGIIGSFQVFTQAYVITSSTGGSNNDLLVYVLNLYRHAFEFHNMGYASALAWILFIILVVLTALVFRGSKNLVHYEGLKG